MNYELVKQLKYAGFPFKEPSERMKEVVAGAAQYLWCSIDGKEYILPTLSELIEACGERFYNLRKTVRWFAAAMFDPDEIRDVWGDTPEEAVAKLWLVLNSKI